MQEFVRNRSTLARILLSSVLLVLSACGGGSDDDNDPPPNIAPIASAGLDFTVAEGAGATLSGSGSDNDGSIASYAWTQTFGPAVALSGANTATASFTAPQVSATTTLQFQLTVTDDDGATGSDTVTVTVTNGGAGGNQPPTANAGPDQTVNEGASVQLAGSGSDSDGTVVSFAWSQFGPGPAVTLSSTSSPTPSFTAPQVSGPTVLGFRLTVTDDDGDTAEDTVSITVNDTTAGNNPPTASAGADQSVTEGATVQLAGSGTDGDGTVASFAWTQTAGPAVTLAGAGTANASFTAPQVDAATVLSFQLTVTDDDGASASDSVDVTVNNTPPGALPGNADLQLLGDSLAALLQGCDILDTAHCLFPFPSNHFTVPAPPGSPQSVARAGSGRRINFNLLGMPRNLVGKPIDPSEWNRNDGFSQGTTLLSFVPGLAANADGSIPGAVPLTDLGQYLAPDAPVIVVDAATGQRHPVWAEIDLNAGKLVPALDLPSILPAQPALIIRPAVNFSEGHRYVAVLRNLKDAAGNLIPPGPAFRVCRDALGSTLLPVLSRCAALEQDVFPVLQAAGIARNDVLYLAWDFTVASAKNNTARLVHMRDDAFVNVLGDDEDDAGNILGFGSAPAFSVTEVTENPNSELARVVKGSFTVPSYVIPSDPSPLDGQAELKLALQQLAALVPEQVNALLDGCDDLDPTGLLCDFLDPNELIDLVSSGSLPPNRLFYNPLDGLNPADPLGSLYGDGLPDRNPLGQLTATFTCNIPKSALSGKDFATAMAADVKPARPSIYGHGLLGSGSEVGAGNVRAMGNDHNMLFCATDWFGFASGDLPNILTVLLDLSNFPLVPDGSQQGMLNQMFLARLLAHPDGFASAPAFRLGDQPVFDRSEVFYDGNSQGGILGGPVIALSKDVNRGVLGVPGMNYSTLLARSVDFDTYSIPLYLAYPNDLDRNLGFALIQMLWDRSENNGYAQHLTRDTLGGPVNRVLLHPAFADHQVSHWTAQVMARTIGVELVDMYPRKPAECGGDVTACFAGKNEFFAQRDPDVVPFFELPLVGRDNSAVYDSAPCTGSCRTQKSALIQFDEGKTAIPPTGNTPPRADGFDPHGFPRASKFGQCQKSHFLHSQGRVIDVRGAIDVTGPGNCPALPAAP